MPRVPLHKSFVRAVRSSRHNQTVLAVLAGYAAQSQLCATLSADAIAVTPKAIERLQRLSAAVGYTGDIFETAVDRG